MNYISGRKYCPICKNSHVIPCSPKTLAGKIEMISDLESMNQQEPHIAVPLSLLMEIYAELKYLSPEVSTLGPKILAIVKGENNEA